DATWSASATGRRADSARRRGRRAGRRLCGAAWSSYSEACDGVGEVVADVAEDVRSLAAKEDHRDDNGNGDDGDDECVFDQTLAFVVAQECEHYSVPLSCRSRCKPARLADLRQLGRSYLRRLG